MAGGKAVSIALTEAERGELEMRSRRRKIGRADAMRAAIVLSAAEGLSNVAIAERVGVTRLTVILISKAMIKMAIRVGLSTGWLPPRRAIRTAARKARIVAAISRTGCSERVVQPT